MDAGHPEPPKISLVRLRKVGHQRWLAQRADGVWVQIWVARQHLHCRYGNPGYTLKRLYQTPMPTDDMKKALSDNFDWAQCAPVEDDRESRNKEKGEGNATQG